MTEYRAIAMNTTEPTEQLAARKKSYNFAFKDENKTSTKIFKALKEGKAPKAIATEVGVSLAFVRTVKYNAGKQGLL